MFYRCNAYIPNLKSKKSYHERKWDSAPCPNSFHHISSLDMGSVRWLLLGISLIIDRARRAVRSYVRNCRSYQKHYNSTILQGRFSTTLVIMLYCLIKNLYDILWQLTTTSRTLHISNVFREQYMYFTAAGDANSAAKVYHTILIGLALFFHFLKHQHMYRQR